MGKNLKGKELGKNIIQRKDGRYQGRYIDRFGKRKSVYGETLNDVRKLLRDLHFYNKLMKEIRIAIEEHRFKAFKSAKLRGFEEGDR